MGLKALCRSFGIKMPLSYPIHYSHSVCKWKNKKTKIFHNIKIHKSFNCFSLYEHTLFVEWECYMVTCLVYNILIITWSWYSIPTVHLTLLHMITLYCLFSCLCLWYIHMVSSSIFFIFLILLKFSVVIYL